MLLVFLLLFGKAGTNYYYVMQISNWIDFKLIFLALN